MNTPAVIKLTSAIIDLPAAQREVLLPLFAWSLCRRAPEGSSVPGWLIKVVEDFLDGLGPDEREWDGRLDERFKAAGITSATLQALALEAGVADDGRVDSPFVETARTPFKPSGEPKQGQLRNGPAARFQLQALGKLGPHREEG